MFHFNYHFLSTTHQQPAVSSSHNQAVAAAALVVGRVVSCRNCWSKRHCTEVYKQLNNESDFRDCPSTFYWNHRSIANRSLIIHCLSWSAGQQLWHMTGSGQEFVISGSSTLVDDHHQPKCNACSGKGRIEEKTMVLWQVEWRQSLSCVINDNYDNFR